MKRSTITRVFVIAASLVLVSCGNYNNSSTTQYSTSRLQFRAFVSNPLRPNSTATVPVLEIIDALQDKLSGYIVNLAGSSPQPGLMALSPNKKFTLVFSGSNSSVTVVGNTNETVTPFGSGSLTIFLPDLTESMLVGVDNATAYAAVRNAPVLGQPAGAVEVLNLAAASISATLPMPNGRYIVGSHNGNRILAFSDSPDTMMVIAPSLVGTTTDPRTFIQSAAFDHPVWGVFSSDDSTAYILSCGAECGGVTASVTVLDMNTNTVGASVPLAAATIGLLDDSTLYVAGTPPGTVCGSGTAASTCGTLQVVDVGSLAATAPVLITDGHHSRIEMGANGQVFVGASTCTNINIPSGEVRGCLSIFNSSDSSVVIPPDNGDVTAIEPIPDRSVVYVAENGELRIYDTTTDKLQSKQINVVGQAIDVKVVDF